MSVSLTTGHGAGPALALPGLSRRRRRDWFAAPDFADLAAIADFNGERYAIPALPAERVPSAPAAALLAKRACGLAEWLEVSTRGGGGLRSHVGADGAWSADLPAGTARFNWSNGRRQLALNEAATNLLANASGTGAAAGMPGLLPTGWFALAAGLSIGVVRTGLEDGMPFVDLRYRGVSSANFGVASFGAVTALAPASTYSLSAYCRLVEGSASPINLASLRFRYNLADGASTDIAVAFALAAGPLRTGRVMAADKVSLGATGTGSLFLQFNWAVGAALDFTVRLALPQLELGGFASPAIATTGGSQGRPGEVAALSPAVAALLRRPAASIVIRGQSMLRADGVLLGLDGPAALLRASQSRTQLVSDGAASLVSGSGRDLAGASWAAGLAFDPAGRSLARDGASPVGDAHAPPAGRGGVWLAGAGPGGPVADGCYDWVGIAPARLAAGRLAQLCVPA